jgi:hypothetical protein
VNSGIREESTLCASTLVPKTINTAKLEADLEKLQSKDLWHLQSDDACY